MMLYLGRIDLFIFINIFLEIVCHEKDAKKHIALCFCGFI